MPSNFNPRTPCGVRLAAPADVYVINRISIHAPRVGCDACSSAATTASNNFNPRTPCGVRRRRPPVPPPLWAFQSTHPVWGATRHDRREVVRRGRFQSTHPVWGATVEPSSRVPYVTSFQSTHPVWGATCQVCPIAAVAPYFNPRTPCGVRQSWPIVATSPRRFQSTHPVWGATSWVSSSWSARGRFQSTHPVWGATYLLTCFPGFPSAFQSTHPVWGAPSCKWRFERVSVSYFNPRTPCGVRLHQPRPPGWMGEISIHAPRVGCDAAYPQFGLGSH